MNKQLKLNEILRLIARRQNALKNIAVLLGNAHPVVKLMGHNAWGRCDAEQGGEGHSLKSACVHLGFLDGVFSILNTWARDNDPKAQQIMLKQYKTDFYVGP